MLCSAFLMSSDKVVRATDESRRPGHPVLLPARIFPALGALEGDDGGRSVLVKEDVQLVELSDRRATTDLDTPEEWHDLQGS